MKKILIATSLLFITSSAIAFDVNKLYVGVGSSTGSGTLTITSDNGYNVSGNYNSSSIPIKIGYVLESDNRFELSTESVQHKFAQEIDIIYGFNIDWDFTYLNHKLFDVITPYWTIGLGSYTYKDTAKIFKDNEDLKGIAFNYGIGGLYSINNSFEIETSLKGKAIKWQNMRSGSNTISTVSTVGLFYLGFNYKF